jgi:hypothetical protein
MTYMAFDSRQRDTLAWVENADGRKTREARMAHAWDILQRFLVVCELSSPAALGTIGNCYRIVDEVEAASCEPNLVHAIR